MKELTFDEVIEVSFYRKEDGSVTARLSFKRNLNKDGAPPVEASFFIPENYPYGKFEVTDTTIKLALKTWIETVAIPLINEYYQLEP
jgi:hypothetical protein